MRWFRAPWRRPKNLWRRPSPCTGWLGAVAIALLFTIGKSLLGLHPGRASATSGYGAARSLIVLLLWCYYAAQIVFPGAEFTRVTALSKDERIFSPLTEPEQRERTA